MAFLWYSLGDCIYRTKAVRDFGGNGWVVGERVKGIACEGESKVGLVLMDVCGGQPGGVNLLCSDKDFFALVVVRIYKMAMHRIFGVVYLDRFARSKLFLSAILNGDSFILPLVVDI